MSSAIFEDTFVVSAVDPDGKVFERGNLLFNIRNKLYNQNLFF
jgi:hypothetical protein